MHIDASDGNDNYSVFTGSDTYAAAGDVDDDSLPDAAPQLKNIRSCSGYQSSHSSAPSNVYIDPSALFAGGVNCQMKSASVLASANGGNNYGCFDARPSNELEEVIFIYFLYS